MAIAGLRKIEDTFEGLHWDLLQVPRRTNTTEWFPKLSSPQTLGQLDLTVAGPRRGLVKRMLTTGFCNLPKDEGSGSLRKGRRDSSNNLMASEVDKLVKEESKSSAGLSKVGSTNSIKLDKTR